VKQKQMKNLLVSLMTVGLVSGAVYGSTSAFFSDTETSAGNILTAGSITLAIQNIIHQGSDLVGFSYNNEAMNFSMNDLKPLDNGTVTYDVLNGDNEAYVCAMVTETSNSENGRNDPEIEAGDDLNPDGELGNFLSFKIGSQSGTLQAIGGLWQTVGVVSANNPTSSAIGYCFGQYEGENCVLGTGNYNLAQTDNLTSNVSFYAEQTRNNPDFNCGDLNTVKNADLASDKTTAKVDGTWFFYNDTNDTIMSLNQFAADGGANEIVLGPDNTGAARMLLGNHVTPRYNIATYRFSDVKLSEISTLKYRVYDVDGTNPPFLNFNVDFNNSDTWQKRLVQVPTLTANTWTEVDALNGMWTYSGAFWPAGGSETGSTPGTTAKTWASIVADYPMAETRSTDSFLGVRVGHPGPVGDAGYVDWIEFDGTRFNFEN